AIGSVLSGNLLSLGPNVAQAGVQSAARSLGDVLFGELARSGVGSLVDTILGTATKTGASGAGEAAQAGREAARTVGDATNELARSAGDATNELARSASDAPKTLEDQLRARFDEATKPENVLGEVKKRGEQLRDGVLEARRSEGRTRGQNAAHTREVAAASEARADATRQRLDGAREDATSIDHLRHDLAATAVRVLG
ncbi:hypothetical protein L6R52_36200, partial [Myxococcota bacterium]|nr:hypothetical protein [Myxococcota bacterium]